MAKEKLFEEIEKIDSECNSLTNQINSLKNQIDEIRKNIKVLDSKKAALGETIAKYSKFSKYQIGPALAELITTISGRKYVYKHATGLYPGKYGMDLPVIEHLNVVVDKTKYKEYYYLAEINGLINEGYAISFYGDDDTPNPLIPPSFFETYGYCTQINNDAIDFNWEKFPYVVEFLKLLVKYACKRDCLFVTVTKEDVNACLKEILKKYKEEHTIKNPTKTIRKKIKKGE